MKLKLNKKNLKSLNNSNNLINNATPLIAGGRSYRDTDLECVPTNRHDCYTGAQSCYGKGCTYSAGWNTCD
ncbi:hypothetical protein CWB96_21505 [Pseudoalteromonas citrea]|uniref:Uncharacterized protein n=1 Tax=Pseudoalteromonas citrea TaxID=43655 RepID=A0A5S3XJ48_9GAMM|nr:hypothetical protein [Pseudoalteromonas citrea]TMP42356.1 hypothetical protein CWB97_12075 [Pseudoalteromonas citrea]TMP52816.1 hypothetical protein CWB96_21505 [Pseudoalteromonas citrea]